MKGPILVGIRGLRVNHSYVVLSSLESMIRSALEMTVEPDWEKLSGDLLTWNHCCTMKI